MVELNTLTLLMVPIRTKVMRFISVCGAGENILFFGDSDQGINVVGSRVGDAFKVGRCEAH